MRHAQEQGDRRHKPRINAGAAPCTFATSTRNRRTGIEHAIGFLALPLSLPNHRQFYAHWRRSRVDRGELRSAAAMNGADANPVGFAAL